MAGCFIIYWARLTVHGREEGETEFTPEEYIDCFTKTERRRLDQGKPVTSRATTYLLVNHHHEGVLHLR